jgi:hypothetical protein
MSDLFPVDKVFTMVDRNSWEILEAAGYQVVIFSYAAYARVRRESLDNGIVETLAENDC